MAWTMKVDAEETVRKNEKTKIALDMKKDGLDVSIIVKYTGLTIDEIEKL